MMLLDYFRFLVGFLKKWTKSANLGNFRVLRLDEGLHHNVAVLRRGLATIHSMETFVFCFVLLFRYSKDLSIRLMRTL